MATYSLANERLRALEDIEREIGAILQNAGSGPSGRHLRSRRWGGPQVPAGAAPALPGQPRPSLRPRRYCDPGTVQGKNQRAAPGPAGGGLHGVGAARGGGAVGSDPLPHPGACGGRCCAPPRPPPPAPPPRSAPPCLACGILRDGALGLWALGPAGTPLQNPPFQGRLISPEGRY